MVNTTVDPSICVLLFQCNGCNHKFELNKKTYQQWTCIINYTTHVRCQGCLRWGVPIYEK